MKPNKQHMNLHLGLTWNQRIQSEHLLPFELRYFYYYLPTLQSVPFVCCLRLYNQTVVVFDKICRATNHIISEQVQNSLNPPLSSNNVVF
jgi:hypothetical protein